MATQTTPIDQPGKSRPEVWLRGPLEDIPLLLQPVAHALLQAKEEINILMNDFPKALLWQRPGGVASVGFHLKHLSGVLDRLFTYAKNGELSKQQLNWLASEKLAEEGIEVSTLLHAFNDQLDHSLQQLRTTDIGILTQERFVGRQRLPSTVIGLLFHAAEHTMRHTGQLLVTVRVLTEKKE